MNDSHGANTRLQIPRGAARALSNYIAKAVNRLDPARYRQEAAYVAALFARLDGVVYHKPNLSIEIKSTVVADRGRGSAESKWGADFGIVAKVIAGRVVTEKGVLGQAKRGSLVNLPGREAETFRQQVVKMNEVTNALIGLEVPNEPFRTPLVRIVESANLRQGIPFRRTFRRLDFTIHPPTIEASPVYMGDLVPLGRYIYAELLHCLHGDTDERLIHGLEDSNLSYLLVEARTGETAS